MTNTAQRASSHSSHSSTEHIRIRRWRRADEPTKGWWPWAILPLLGLALLALLAFLYVAPSRVEADVRETTIEKLKRAGFPWARVEANGQNLKITGSAPGPVNEQLLRQFAANTDCDTWYGDLECPIDVDIDIDAWKPVAAVPLKPAPTENRRFHDFDFKATPKQLILTGEVPSAAAKRAIVAKAKATHFGKRIVNRLTISNQLATPKHPLAFERAFTVLDQLDSGSARWTAGKLHVSGFVVQANEQTARNLFADPQNNPGLGDLKLSLKEAADSCDKEFSNLLTKSTIRFASGRALIAKSSRKLLGQLAKLAKRCPGDLQIEGHTDNVGKPAVNKTLSQRRANAVVTALGQLGVNPDRLHGQGFGSDRPTATNDTALGRAKNRRIEIRIAR